MITGSVSRQSPPERLVERACSGDAAAGPTGSSGPWLENVQGTLLLAALEKKGISGDAPVQLTRWAKALGQLDVSEGSAAELFEALSARCTFTSSMEGICTASALVSALVAMPIPEITGNVTPLLSSLQFLKLKYKLMLSGFQVADLNERMSLDSEEFVAAMSRLGVNLSLDAAQKASKQLSVRQRWKSDYAVEAAVGMLCHQMALEGSVLPDLDLSIIGQVRCTLLQAMFVTIDKDRSGTLEQDEVVEAMLQCGANDDDASCLFDVLAAKAKSSQSQEGGSRRRPSVTEVKALNFQIFHAAMTMDESDLRILRKHCAARFTLAFARCRRILLSVSFERVGMTAAGTKLRQVSFHQWIDAMRHLGVEMETAGKIFVLLDTNHHNFLTFHDLEQLLCCKVQEQEGETVQQVTNALQGVHGDGEGPNPSKSKVFKLYDAAQAKWTGRAYTTSLKEIKHSRCSRLPPNCLQRLVESPFFDTALGVMGMIVLFNGVVAGVEANTVIADSKRSASLKIAWYLVSTASIVELALKVCAYRIQYFHSSFNTLDSLVIFLCALDVWILDAVGKGTTALRAISVLRFFRLLRVTDSAEIIKKFTQFREVQLLVRGLIAGTRTLVWTIILLLLMMYVSAAFAMLAMAPNMDTSRVVDVDIWAHLCESNDTIDLDSEDTSDWSRDCALHAYFGTVDRSMFTMLQILTLDDWSEITRPLEEASPGISLFFVAFICLSTFVIVNLVTGVFLDQTLSVAREDEIATLERIRRRRNVRVDHLRELFMAADLDQSGELNEQEFDEMLKNPNVRSIFAEVGYEDSDLEELFHVLDADGGGFVELDEFVTGILKMQREVKVADLIEISRNQIHCMQLIDDIATRGAGIQMSIKKALTSQATVRQGSGPSSPRSRFDTVSSNESSDSPFESHEDLPNYLDSSQIQMLKDKVDNLQRSWEDQITAAQVDAEKHVDAAADEVEKLVQRLGNLMESFSASIKPVTSLATEVVPQQHQTTTSGKGRCCAPRAPREEVVQVESLPTLLS